MATEESRAQFLYRWTANVDPRYLTSIIRAGVKIHPQLPGRKTPAIPHHPALLPAQMLDGLNVRIQALPQELQDMILQELLDSSLPSGMININPGYKPPLGLQIDHKLRESFARKFYKAGAVHHGPNGPILRPDEFDPTPLDSLAEACDLMAKWLRSLCKAHRQLVQAVQFGVMMRKSINPAASDILTLVARKLLDFAVPLDQSSRTVRVLRMEEDDMVNE